MLDGGDQPQSFDEVFALRSRGTGSARAEDPAEHPLHLELVRPRIDAVSVNEGPQHLVGTLRTASCPMKPRIGGQPLVGDQRQRLVESAHEPALALGEKQIERRDNVRGVGGGRGASATACATTELDVSRARNSTGPGSVAAVATGLQTSHLSSCRKVMSRTTRSA